MNPTQITNAMRELCYFLNLGRQPQWGSEMIWRSAEAGVIRIGDDPDHTVTLTDAGHMASAEWRKKIEARNRLNRGRHQAMRDLGMTRTPYGWE